MAHEVLARVVLAALVFSVIVFIFQFRRAAARGRATACAPPRGDVRRGALYALTLGMDPRRKDGARYHPWVLAAGTLFHLGVLAALLTAAALFGWRSTLPGPWWNLLAVLQAAGAMAALSLLARRSRSAMLRAISAADDYVSTTAVFALLASGAGAIVAAGLVPAFAAALVFVLVYAPFGKIRHCVLFFPVRLQYGRFLGRRGVLPPRARVTS